MAQNTQIRSKQLNLDDALTLPNGTIATTQSQGDNSTKLATTSYVDTAVGNINFWDRSLLGDNYYLTPHVATDGMFFDGSTNGPIVFTGNELISLQGGQTGLVDMQGAGGKHTYLTFAVPTAASQTIRFPDGAGDVAVSGVSTGFTAKQYIFSADPTNFATSQLFLNGTALTGAANTGAALTFSGFDGVTATDWAQILGVKSNSTSGDKTSYLRFQTKNAAGTEILSATLTNDTFGVQKVDLVNLLLSSGTYNATLTSGTLTGDIAITGPTSAGTLALTSDISTAITNLKAAGNIWTNAGYNYFEGPVDLRANLQLSKTATAAGFIDWLDTTGSPKGVRISQTYPTSGVNSVVLDCQSLATSRLLIDGTGATQTIAGTWTFNNSTTFGTAGTAGTVNLYDASSVLQTHLTASGSSFINYSNGNNLGIRTNNPLTNLHVDATNGNYNLCLSNSGGAADEKNWILWAAYNKYLFLQTASDNLSSTANVIIFVRGTGVAMDSTCLMGGNIGINKISPAQTLAIDGSIGVKSLGLNASYNPSTLTTNTHLTYSAISSNYTYTVPTEDIQNSTTSLTRWQILTDATNSGAAKDYPITIAVESGSLVGGDKISTRNGLAFIYTDGTYTYSYTLAQYSQTTHSSTFSGPWASASATKVCTLIRHGNVVTLTIPSVIAAYNSDAYITMTTVLPSGWRPAIETYRPIKTQNNSANTAGFATIGTDGSIKIYNNAQDDGFSTGGNCGFYNIDISWVI